jgi:ABC-type dipeptide/oligopeptide/nickel transport system permease subunit
MACAAATTFWRRRRRGRAFAHHVRHILPNALAPVLVSATLGVAGAIWWSPRFLPGAGVQPPSHWGICS